MKKTILLLGWLLFVMCTTSAQSKMNFKLQVLDNQSNPVADLSVSLIETTSKKRIHSKTRADGSINFEINYGREWSVNVGEMKNCSFIEIPESGFAEQSKILTYDLQDYRRMNRPNTDRSAINFTTVDQTKNQNFTFTDEQALVRLILVRENGKPLIYFPVQLTCFKLKKIFLSSTNEKGIAQFIVPHRNDYEVDLDNIENFNYIDVKQSGNYALKTTYEPTEIIEKETNDTIVQTLKNQTNGTSSRVFVKLKVKQIDAKDLTNEAVYLQMLRSNKVYKAKPNPKGEVYFLIPNKKKYMVHFRYQKDIDVLNYKDMQGISSAEAEFTYHPDPKLQFPERFVPTPNNLFLKDFLEFLYLQYPEPSDDAAVRMDVSWGNNEVNMLSKEAILQLGFKAKKDDGKLYGPPLNIALVVDISGSMEGNDRLAALKTALLNYIKKLRPTDIVSLVAFNHEATVLVPAQKIGDGLYLKDMIEDMQASGGTDIYKGMIEGYEQVTKNYIESGTNRVLLLTDGYDSRPVEEVVKASKAYNKKGIELSAIGVGESYNQSLLTLLASEGGGLLNFIADSKNINKAFEKDLNSVLSPCASNLTVEIVYNKQILFKALYGHPFTKTNDLVTMTLNNVYSGLNTLALVQFTLNQPNEEIEKEPIIIKMTYYDFSKQKVCKQEEKTYLKWVPALQNFEIINEAQHKKLYAIAVLNQSLKVMAEAFEKNNNELALNTIQSTIEQIKRIYPKAKDDDVEKLVATASNYASALTRIIKNKKENAINTVAKKVSK